MSGSYEFVEIQMQEYILANKYMDIHVNKYALEKKQCRMQATAAISVCFDKWKR